MNCYERVMNRLVGKPVDRIPNLCILMTFAAKYIHVPYDQFVQDYRLLVEGNIRCCEDFKIDLLSAISDPAREASDLGAAIAFPVDDVPHPTVPFVSQSADLAKLKLVKPEDGRRMSDRLAAVSLYREKAGKEYPVMGWVEGAFAEACDLDSVSNIMISVVDDPEFTAELLEFCTQQAILFAEAQVDAGADFIGIGDAAASLISPRMYRKWAMPYEKRIIEAIHRKGAKAKLHICGNTSHFLSDLPQTGADMIDADWMVDFKTAVDTFGDQASACGNFDPVSVMLNGTPDTVHDAVAACIQVARPNTFIAAGCEVPKNTPIENLKMVAQTIQEAALNPTL
ncbi:MAG TPA: uroporphyrinogen decarboxylase family protein [Flexilinea sp.]|jgi:MtaA/CmuA family methyltransferase|nr:uroporphyrinogen decarboxylase family protein [Flexilinea sp.]HOP02620.1 uroporphyrinogen decarboxylase family protein [Flexilinea sp.]HPJ65634.1 uroporphyrinogen decarboxylase family protein [Flexilinea sp.]HPR71509.1 uroporphyrinogen decarboxylase family protein [Flexilinea sp.]HPS47061.1 uroporphyrinogen decarboxylase family protein [Flexilinea sp.]